MATHALIVLRSANRDPILLYRHHWGWPGLVMPTLNDFFEEVKKRQLTNDVAAAATLLALNGGIDRMEGDDKENAPPRSTDIHRLEEYRPNVGCEVEHVYFVDFPGLIVQHREGVFDPDEQPPFSPVDAPRSHGRHLGLDAFLHRLVLFHYDDLSAPDQEELLRLIGELSPWHAQSLMEERTVAGRHGHLRAHIRDAQRTFETTKKYIEAAQAGLMEVIKAGKGFPIRLSGNVHNAASGQIIMVNLDNEKLTTTDRDGNARLFSELDVETQLGILREIQDMGIQDSSRELKKKKGRSG
jgi:hypothetical protein